MTKIFLTFFYIFALCGGFSGQMLRNIPVTSAMNVSSGAAVIPLQADTARTLDLTLQNFINSVYTGEADVVRGIYVADVLALPVVQQPADNAGFVSREADQATQFGMASRYGTIGILAHNDLAGSFFYDVPLSGEIIVVYGDRHTVSYQVTEAQQYQALQPNSPYSEFLNLANTAERLSAGDLFNRVYAPGERIVLQTCIAANGEASWGRLFVIAEPVPSVKVAEGGSLWGWFSSLVQ